MAVRVLAALLCCLSIAASATAAPKTSTTPPPPIVMALTAPIATPPTAAAALGTIVVNGTAHKGYAICADHHPSQRPDHHRQHHNLEQQQPPQQQRRQQLEANLYATLVENIRQNSRKLKLEDFSWGIFGGTRGRLLGLRDYALQLRHSDDDVGRRRLNVEYRLTVPVLRATWEKSSCMGYGCAMTIELDACEFAVRLSLDGRECAVDHLAFLQRYEGARCHAAYDRSSPIGVACVETTVRLLSYALNTDAFEKTVADNVNHALLRLPLFNGTDIRNLCDEYQQLHS